MRQQQLERELALLEWMHFQLDPIEADLPSSPTPLPNIAPNTRDCCHC
jgi:hypothetical protein